MAREGRESCEMNQQVQLQWHLVLVCANVTVRWGKGLVFAFCHLSFTQHPPPSPSFQSEHPFLCLRPLGLLFKLTGKEDSALSRELLGLVYQSRVRGEQRTRRKKKKNPKCMQSKRRRKMTMSRRAEKKGQRSLWCQLVWRRALGAWCGEKWRTVLQYRREQEGERVRRSGEGRGEDGAGS